MNLITLYKQLKSDRYWKKMGFNVQKSHVEVKTKVIRTSLDKHNRE